VSVGLNWGSLAFVHRLIHSVQDQGRYRCEVMVEVRDFPGRRVVGRGNCQRPVGHPGRHRSPDGRFHQAGIVSPPSVDPVRVAEATMRRAEIAVRRSKRKGKRR
jgi:hypothetical protein